MGNNVPLDGTGNDLDNVIAGNSEGDAEHGLDGNDTLLGGTGNDTLWGDDGTDSLSGEDGRDILYWDTDDIRVDGGADNDVLMVAGAGVTLDLTGIAGSVILGIE